MTDKFAAIAETYLRSRDTASLNHRLLDSLMLRLALASAPTSARVLDIGCGIGSLSLELARHGYHVTAVDSSPAMLHEFRRRLSRADVLVSLIEGDALSVDWGVEPFELVLLNLILDHLEAANELVERCARSLTAGGSALVVLPHPFKDAGGWRKIRTPHGWYYLEYVVDNYFNEGPMTKVREDQQGDVMLSGLASYRRTLSTYIDMFLSAGFRIARLLEPKPEVAAGELSRTDREKSSRIPYFLVVVCQKP